MSTGSKTLEKTTLSAAKTKKKLKKLKKDKDLHFLHLKCTSYPYFFLGKKATFFHDQNIILSEVRLKLNLDNNLSNELQIYCGMISRKEENLSSQWKYFLTENTKYIKQNNCIRNVFFLLAAVCLISLVLH